MKEGRKVWVAAGCSATGGAHRRRGEGGDDAHLVLVAGRTCYLAAADGAGGAKHSAEGSKAAVFAAMDWLQRNKATPADPQRYTLMVRCFAAARFAVTKRAGLLGVEVGELATTLTVAIVNEGGVLAGQVGDGALVIENHEAVRAVLWDSRPGAVNKSDFLTDRDYVDGIRTLHLRERPIGAVIVTDGVEGLTVGRQGETNEGFYHKLLQTVRARPEWGEGGGLERFLESPAIRERCDDDLTIVAVALKEEPRDARQSAQRTRRQSIGAKRVPHVPRLPPHPAPRRKDGGGGGGRCFPDGKADAREDAEER